MQTIIATVVKDEAHRYWRSALKAWSEFADSIVVLDDDSTDATGAVAAEFDKVDLFKLIDGQDLWGHESAHRAALFTYAMRKGDPGDVVFWLDADMVPTEDPRPYFKAGGDTFAFYLYDLWGKGRYRSDSFWRGHENQRVWALRVPQDFISSNYEWEHRGLHSGHIPGSWWLRHNGPVCYVPRSCSLLHYGYFTRADREDRHQRYLNARRHLTGFELAHAQSIMDPEPTLEKLLIPAKWELQRANSSR